MLVGLQLLRGLAAALVVLSHCNTMMGHAEFFGTSPFPIRQSGAFGVGIFFVLSGFIIAYVTLDERLAPRLTVSAYARRRFIRIVPFLWLCALGYNLLSYVGTGTVEWLPMLRGLLLWPVGELKPNVLWSLRHEWIFYVLFAVALMGRRRRPWILGAWFAAPLLYGGALAAGWVAEPADADLAELLRVVLLGSDYGANLQFAAGFGLGVLRLRQAPLLRERARMPLAAALAAAILGAALAEALALPRGLPRDLLWTVLPAAIVWTGLASAQRHGPLARIGIVLGDASFSIYLLHNPVLLILFRIGRHAAGSMPLAAMHLAFVAVAIAVGVAVHYLVEAPLIARLAHGTRVAPWQRPRPAQR